LPGALIKTQTLLLSIRRPGQPRNAAFSDSLGVPGANGAGALGAPPRRRRRRGPEHILLVRRQRRQKRPLVRRLRLQRIKP